MKALITVSFGTTHDDTRCETIEAFHAELVNRYPDYEPYQAYTSSIVRKKLASRGIKIPSLDQVLSGLDEHAQVLVVPTHLVAGSEYEKIMESLSRYDHEYTLGKPLMGGTNGIRALANFIVKTYVRPGVFSLLMGHGSEKAAEAYTKLNDYLVDESVTIACVEGEPMFESALEILEGSESRDILLAPLMFVAGEHAKNDMVGEDSWQERLEALGYSVHPVLTGLGSYESYRKLLIDRLEENCE